MGTLDAVNYLQVTLDAVNYLQVNGLSKLEAKDQTFVNSLLSAYHKGKATAKQLYWIEKMAEKAKSGKVGGLKENEPLIEFPGYDGVYALLGKAGINLKHPKITLKLPEYGDGEQLGDGVYASKSKGGQVLQLHVAGPASKYKGKIMVTDGKAYPGNKWFGCIDPSGKFSPGLAMKKEPAYVQDDILKMLKGLAEKPAEVAAAYGKMTGHCCFCKLALSDPKSVAVGYGPICAGHFGLPWGTVGEFFLAIKQAKAAAKKTPNDYKPGMKLDNSADKGAGKMPKPDAEDALAAGQFAPEAKPRKPAEFLF